MPVVEQWLIVIIVSVVVIVAGYFTALCLISVWRGEPVFRFTKPWWSRRLK